MELKNQETDLRNQLFIYQIDRWPMGLGMSLDYGVQRSLFASISNPPPTPP